MEKTTRKKSGTFFFFLLVVSKMETTALPALKVSC